MTQELTESTNNSAKSEAFSVSEPVKYYLADQQSHGRGRDTNKWENPAPGHSLMLSASYDLKQAAQPVATPLVGLAVTRALKKSFPKATISLKAPNDVYLNGAKLAGLLVEVVQMGEQQRLILGLGLNVFSAPESVENATYLATESRVTPNKWKGFLQNLTHELRLASQEAMGTHLSDSQRQEILSLLNKNPSLKTKYDSISPFGDLSSAGQVTSWREL